MEFEKLSLIELCDGIKSQKYTSKEVVEYFVKRCEEKKDLKAVIFLYPPYMRLHTRMRIKRPQSKFINFSAF